MKHSQGFTLIEALVVLVISSITGAMAASTWQDMSQRAEARNAINMIATSLYSARNTAMTRNQPVSLCGSSNGLECDKQWQAGILVFVDPASTGIPASSNDIISYSHPGARRALITWKGFGSSRMGFDARGRTSASNGTFTYCATNHQLRYARQIVINRGGRVRFSHDHNGDGTHESASGAPISCT